MNTLENTNDLQFWIELENEDQKRKNQKQNPEK